MRSTDFRGFIIRHFSLIGAGVLTACVNALANAQDAAPKPHISLIQAIDAAQRQIPGEATSAHLVSSDAGSFYDVEITSGAKTYAVRVTQDSGFVTSSSVVQDAQNSPAGANPASQDTTSDVAKTVVAQKAMSFDGTAYINSSTGQIAGMNNTILHPKLTLGARTNIRLGSMPELETKTDLYAIDGTVNSAAGYSSMGLQEIRGSLDSVYNFYNERDISKAGLGLYSEFALPLHQYEPYYRALSTDYAVEESEPLSREFLTGLDLKLSMRHDKLESDFHNIVFLGGNRIGPNLITYKPLLGFMWHSDYHIFGNVDQPKLSFFTDVNVYFAKKSATATFNSHDGIGGTKRELYLSYGFAYAFNRDISLSLWTYGYNNVNRGDSTQVPSGFRDGFVMSLSHKF